MRVAVFFLAMSTMSGVAVADDACQGLLDRLTAGVEAADKVSGADKMLKCRAYERVAMDLGETPKACSGSQQDVDFVKMKFPALAKRVADGEQQYCGR